MKIIHVTQFLGIGGLEKIVLELAKEQQKLGHNVSVYVYDSERSWVSYFRQQGIQVLEPELKKPGYDFDLLKRMKNDLLQCDVIHTHDLNPLMYLAPLYFSLRFFKKLPALIHTAHGMDHVKNYKRALTYEKIVSKMVNQIIAVSKHIEEFYINACGIDKKRVHFIRNGIKIPEQVIDKTEKMKMRDMLIQRYQLDPQKPILMALSRVTPLKDQLFLIEALKKRNDISLLIAGPPSDQSYFDKCQRELSPHMKMIGAQSEVLEHNMGADLYVSASTHEGIPVAVLEAMVAKTPVLVSNIPGHSILNQFGEAAILYNIHDQADFLSHVDQLLSKNNDKLVEHSQQIVRQHFSIEKMVQEYMGVYQCALS
ncbi:MAG: glycosyltransferase family 1 protein [Bdellovibrio sp.]